MKNYKDMADAVFTRRDEYVASVKRKKKIALNASLSLCAVCLAVLGAFGIWKTGVLEPDPDIIGTKPQGYSEPASENTLHSFGSNATSEGMHSDVTEIISGNTKPQNNVNPTEDSKAQSTDPAEKVTKPALRPTVPTLKPTLPTLPIGPKPPSLTPDVPPTSGDDRYPQSQTPVVTDPVESEPGNDNVNSDEVPDTQAPTLPIVPPTTVQPTTQEPGFAAPDEPAYTEPCTQAPDAAPETMAPQEPTDPTVSPMPPTEDAAPDVPPTSVEVNRVEGKVLDQYGNPVKGAVVKVYYNGEVYGTDTTGSNGYYYIAKFRAPATIEISSVPSGYTLSGLSVSISKGYNNIVLTCNKK